MLFVFWFISITSSITDCAMTQATAAFTSQVLLGLPPSYGRVALSNTKVCPSFLPLVKSTHSQINRIYRSQTSWKSSRSIFNPSSTPRIRLEASQSEQRKLTRWWNISQNSVTRWRSEHSSLGKMRMQMSQEAKMRSPIEHPSCKFIVFSISQRPSSRTKTTSY